MKNVNVLGTAVLMGLLIMASDTLAGRPLAIDDADPVDPSQFEFEAGAAYEHDSDCKHWDFPIGLTYGLAPSIEVGAGFGGQMDDREHDISDLVVGAKWQFLESCPLGARHALAGSVKLPTADESKELGSGKTDYDLTWIASRSIGEKAGVHLNFGYSWIGGPDDDVLHYGVALDYQILDAVQLVGEVFAERELANGTKTVVQYNTGFRWNPSESLTVDLAGGSKIAGDAPDFTVTAGLTWSFGLNANGK